METDLVVLQRVLDSLSASIGLVQPSMLDSATPCADWSIRDLLDHVTGGNRYTVLILDGRTSDEALAQVRASFAEPHDPVAAASDSTRELGDSFVAPGVFQRRCDHVVGEVTSTDILQMRTHDVAVHTWDLQQALGSDQGLDRVYARWAIDELRRADSLTALHMATGLEKPNSPDELLVAFGRQLTTT